MELKTIRKIGEDVFECKYWITGQLAYFNAERAGLLQDIQNGENFVTAKNDSIAELDVKIALWNSATDVEMPM
jgi:hypothetical protein